MSFAGKHATQMARCTRGLHTCPDCVTVPGENITAKAKKTNWVHWGWSPTLSYCGTLGAVTYLRSTGENPDEEHIVHLSPLMRGHINMLGHYTFTLPDDIQKGELRTLNFNLNNALSP